MWTRSYGRETRQRQGIETDYAKRTHVQYVHVADLGRAKAMGRAQGKVQGNPALKQQHCFLVIFFFVLFLSSSSSSSSSSSIPYSFLLSPRVYDPTTPKDLPCALGLVKILPCSCLVQRLILRLVVANDLKRPTLPAAGAEAGVRCTISKPLVLSSMTKAQRTMRPKGPKRSWQIGLCS